MIRRRPFIRGRFVRGTVVGIRRQKHGPARSRDPENVRQLARQATIAEIQEELFDLADRLERMGETDPAVGSKRLGKDGLREI